MKPGRVWTNQTDALLLWFIASITVTKTDDASGEIIYSADRKLILTLVFSCVPPPKHTHTDWDAVSSHCAHVMHTVLSSFNIRTNTWFETSCFFPTTENRILFFTFQLPRQSLRPLPNLKERDGEGSETEAVGGSSGSMSCLWGWLCLQSSREHRVLIVPGWGWWVGVFVNLSGSAEETHHSFTHSPVRQCQTAGSPSCYGNDSAGPFKLQKSEFKNHLPPRGSEAGPKHSSNTGIRCMVIAVVVDGRLRATLA